jgi:hypothetical protein
MRETATCCKLGDSTLQVTAAVVTVRRPARTPRRTRTDEATDTLTVSTPVSLDNALALVGYAGAIDVLRCVMEP